MKKINDYFPEIIEENAPAAAKAMNDAIETVDENLSYKDFALAVAAILKDEYGSHNFAPFMEILHAELGMNESLNEGEDDVSLGKEFTKKFNFKASTRIPGKLEIIHKDDINKSDFEEMIKWVESKGYTVDRDQSDNIFDWDDDRYWYPRIMYK